MKNVYFLLMSENECKMKKFYKKDVKVENNKKKLVLIPVYETKLDFKTRSMLKTSLTNEFNL